MVTSLKRKYRSYMRAEMKGTCKGFETIRIEQNLLAKDSSQTAAFTS